MFRKTIWIMVISMTLLMFSSCGIFDAISPGEARAQLNAFNMSAVADEVMDAIQARDAEKLKSMMSANMLENNNNLDSEIEKLIDYIDGNISNYQYYAAGEEWSKRKTQYRICNNGRIDFETEKGKYRIWVDYEVVNTYVDENKGICLLSIYNLDVDEEGAEIKAPPAPLFDFSAEKQNNTQDSN